jgi:hypothetical protein
VSFRLAHRRAFFCCSCVRCWRVRKMALGIVSFRALMRRTVFVNSVFSNAHLRVVYCTRQESGTSCVLTRADCNMIGISVQSSSCAAAPRRTGNGVPFAGSTGSRISLSGMLNCMSCPCVSGVTLGLVRNSDFSNILDLRIGV